MRRVPMPTADGDDVADDEHRHDQAQDAERDEERDVDGGVLLGGLS